MLRHHDQDHDIQDELAKRYPRATVIRDVLYVRRQLDRHPDPWPP